MKVKISEDLICLENLEFLLEALEHILVLVREMMLLPYYIEKWSLVVDVLGNKSFKISENIFEKIYERIRDNFPQTIHKIYIFGTFVFQDENYFNWNRKDFIVNFEAFSKFKEKERLLILQSRKYSSEFFDDVERSQLQKKYGGDIKDLSQFW